jgi:ATP-dependent DNA helicase DinG
VAEVDESAATLALETEKVLGPSGRLSQTLEGFVPRAAQIQLAAAVVNAIEARSILLAEAGTGTGKTFAYLVPALLSAKKIVISTATKTLQDQLFHRDLPALLQALALPRRLQNLKGRANYLCIYRTKLHAEAGHFTSQKSAQEVIYVREKLARVSSGERSELPELSEDAPVWPYVTSTVDNCLAAECPDYQQCFLVKARKRALEADVVVINHHLYFADSRLKSESVGELLPGADLIIFDEAHHLIDIAAQFYTQRLGTRQFRDVMDDSLREWPILDLANRDIKKISEDLDRTLNDLQLALPPQDERLAWEQVQHRKPLLAACDALLSLVQTWLTNYPTSQDEAQAGLMRCKARLEELLALFQAFRLGKAMTVRWLERFKHHVVFHSTPLDIAALFQAELQRQKAAYVFTSATLTMAQSFACFTESLGIVDAQECILSSPFDFEKQALLYLPRGLPDTKDPRYYEALLERAKPVINACGGRCFMLFTSHRALKEVAARLSQHFNYPLLIQGEEAKPILLERFRQLGNAVLLGTASFWEGVDVKGEALSCVIIDKLPFASPTDPVLRAKMAFIKAQGGSGFDELSLPNAVLALKQGVGRLIRDVSDQGVLMIADPRLTGRAYGKLILDSLPPMRKTREEQTVLAFINEWVVENEVISD